MYSSLAVFAIIIYCSFLIASRSQSADTRSNPIRYWFSGNDVSLSIFSNVGSTFSIALVCTTIALAFKAGPFAIVFVLSGAVLSALLFLLLLRHRGITKFFFSHTGPQRPRAFTEYLAHAIGPPAAVLLTFVFIAWMLLVASIELSTARLFFAHLFPRDLILSRFLTFAIISICAGYVSIGGYLGVLRTDRFQFYIVSITSTIIAVFIVRAWLFTGVDVSAISSSFKSQFRVSGGGLVSEEVILVFAVAMLFPTLMDFWIRNFGTLGSERACRRSVLVSCGLVVPFVLITLAVGISAREVYGWPADVDKPFYHAVGLIDAMIARGSDPAPSTVVESLLSTGIWSHILMPAVVAMVSVMMLTTLSTMLITCAQLFIVARDRFGLNRFRDMNGSTFVLLAAVLVGLHSGMSGDYVFAGWGTVGASLFLTLASIVLWVLLVRPRMTHSGAAVAVGLTVATVVVTMALAYTYYYLPFIKMNSWLSSVYILAWPASVGLVRVYEWRFR